MIIFLLQNFAGKNFGNLPLEFRSSSFRSFIFSYFYDSRAALFMKCNWLIIFFMALMTGNTFAQQFYFTNISTEQGLPSSETYHTLQDSHGYTWITTDAGLCRFDGRTITTFTTKDGISENVVFNIREDRKGRVWFSTLSGFLFYFDYADLRFHRIAANNELKKICGRYLIHSFFIGPGDTLYCFYASRFGVIKVAPADNYSSVSYQRMPVYFNRLILQNGINKKELMTGGNTAFTVKDSIFILFNKKRFSIEKAKSPLSAGASNAIFSSIDNQGKLYLFDHGDLHIIDTLTGALENHTFPMNGLCVKKENDGDLWIGTLKGGYFVKKGDFSQPPLYFLPDLSISDIMVDREGIVWICTLEKGLFRILNKNIRTISLTDKPLAFFVSGGQQHIGMASGEELTITSQDPVWYTIQRQTWLPGKNIFKGLFVSKGDTLYATDIGLFHAGEKGLEPLLCIDTGLVNREIVVKQMVLLNNDSVLASCAEGCIYYINKGKISKRIKLAYDLNVIKKLKSGKVIAGTRNTNGLFELKNEMLIPFMPELPELHARVNFIAEDEDDNLWIATNEKGLFCFSKQKLYCFSQKSGLLTDKINSVAFDPGNRVWAGTARGLARIDYSKGLDNADIISFSTNNGLPDLEIQHIVEYNGNIWCGSKNSLFYFSSDKLRPDLVPPQINITSIKMNDVEVDFSGDPVFKYNQNNLNVSFDGLSYKSVNLEYLYKLEGYDSQWTKSGTAELQFTNLPAGKYTFMLYAINNKVSSIKPAMFRFTILKPFWLTWWFIALCILFMVVCMGLFVYWRINTIKRREYIKTQLNKKMAKFQLTAVRAQMNPHFIFNAISSIQHYILENDSFRSYDYLSKFSLLVRNVLDNSKEEYILIEKEIDTLKLYMELEQIRFKEPFTYTIHIDESLNMDNTYIPTMLIQPYVENAIWHGFMPKKTGCRLEINFKKAGEDRLEIIIRDNGVGRNATGAHKRTHASKAMSLTRERLDALKIKNDSDYRITVTDLRDAAGNAAGTEIMLQIELIYD